MNSSLFQIKHFGNSMLPTLCDGDTILISSNFNVLQTGDIIFFKDLISGDFVSHRIISEVPLITKGDRNLFSDDGKILIHGLVLGRSRKKKITCWGKSGQTFKLLLAFFSKSSLQHKVRLIRWISQFIIFILNLRLEKLVL